MSGSMEVWLSMHPASILCFYDNKRREAFLAQVGGHKRKEKAHSLVRKHRVFTVLLYPKVQQSVHSERCLQCFSQDSSINLSCSATVKSMEAM